MDGIIIFHISDKEEHAFFLMQKTNIWLMGSGDSNKEETERQGILSH